MEHGRTDSTKRRIKHGHVGLPVLTMRCAARELRGGVDLSAGAADRPWLIVLAVYLRGWRAAAANACARTAGVAGGLFYRRIASLWIALASPIDALDDYLLVAHMMQHFILMSVAPPLLVLGAPLVPMLRGLPRWLDSRVVGRCFGRALAHTVVRLADASGLCVAGDEYRVSGLACAGSVRADVCVRGEFTTSSTCVSSGRRLRSGGW